jgi:hypothetical protein
MRGRTRRRPQLHAQARRSWADRRWLVLLGIYGQPSYFFCPECEQTDAEWIERQLGEEGERAGCTGIVRLETGSPAEVYGLIRDMLVQAEVV